MNLADARLKQLDNPSVTESERILLRCSVAGDYIHKGQYEAAREALGELWPGIGLRPEVNEFPPAVAAEVLLQCGTLTGWLGSARNLAGSQEQAKDLLSEALHEFQSQGRYEKVSEAQYELGICYWRLGAHDEARVVLLEALKPLRDTDTELKAKIQIRRALVETWENRYYEALSILKEAEPIFVSANDALKGRWHGQMGLVLIRLASVVGNVDYADRAIIEFTAAIYHYEQAGHQRYSAVNLNNLGMLLYKLGRYREAHEHLDRAQIIFTKLKDAGNLAQVDETRARVLVAEKKYREADRILKNVINIFEQGGESAALADALTVQGVAWARLGTFESSISILHRAADVAEGVGALTSGGLALLTLIEEHGGSRLSPIEISKAYLRADSLLKETQDVEDIARLRACGRTALRRFSGSRLHDETFSFYGAVQEFEATIIEQALEETGGSVTRAAKLLGLKHQTLITMLNARHKNLLAKRTPPEKKLRSIINKDS
ncbi:MAG TPA: tetratricopeptide repeat protein [Pyrinomonadaceae bacterium]|nr:tetratricopeptide repeat protein [Pyrinomonadaceae bacterium]